MIAGELPVRQLFVLVERETARMRMRLVPVQAGGEPLAAVNRGVGIVPLEILGDHHPLTEVYHVFRGLDLSKTPTSGAERLDSVFAAWSTALARYGIGLRRERRALYGVPLPRTSWRTDARGISLRPWDIELTALAAGLRRIVKLDRIPPALVESLRHRTAQRGLQAEVVAPPAGVAEATDPAGSVTLLVARDTSALDESRDLEALLLVGRDAPGARAATLQMGELLGYPRCCVERFTRVAEQNDTTLAWALLPAVPHTPAPPLTQWLQPGLALLSHAPCDLHCAPSIALGGRILQAVEAGEPGFTARWHALAARLQVVDQRGTRMALAVDGRLEADPMITAADVLASDTHDPNAETRAQELVGRAVSAESGGLVIADAGWWAAYVADHRGPLPA